MKQTETDRQKHRGTKKHTVTDKDCVRKHRDTKNTHKQRDEDKEKDRLGNTQTRLQKNQGDIQCDQEADIQ